MLLLDEEKILLPAVEGIAIACFVQPQICIKEGGKMPKCMHQVSICSLINSLHVVTVDENNFSLPC